VTEPLFPLWAFITKMTAIVAAFIFQGLLLRRLRLVHPTTWEKLGRPSLTTAWPGSIIAFLDRVEANIRLVVFPFQSQSFQLGDSGTAILLWMVRATLGLVAVFAVWSWWANR
jgi:hypothetical protein